VFGGKSQSKKGRKLDLSCPYCGHGQSEPSIAISSYCRRCGEYFRIKKGVAVARPGLAVSGINPVEEPAGDEVGLPDHGEREKDVFLEETALEAWLRSARGGKGRSIPLGDSGADSEAGSGENGASASGEGAVPVEDDAVSADPVSSRDEDSGPDENDGGAAREVGPTQLGEKAQSRDALAQGSISALIQLAKPKPESADETFGSNDAKMPPNFVPPGRKRRRSRDRIKVRCFRCNHMHSVTRYATSTQCGRCSAYIGLADYEIRGEQRAVLRTRGNVTVTRRGAVLGEELSCHDLHVLGPVDARLDCSGDVVIRHDSCIRGAVNCETFFVERRCRVEVVDGLFADHVDVHGTLSGDIAGAGSVSVHRGGRIEGDVIARSIEVSEGGTVGGRRIIDGTVDPSVPLKEGLSSPVIE